MNEESTPTVADRIDSHKATMSEKLSAHTARSEARLDNAVGKTSDVIGKVANFVGTHVPESVGKHVDSVAARAHAALDENTSR